MKGRLAALGLIVVIGVTFAMADRLRAPLDLAAWRSKPAIDPHDHPPARFELHAPKVSLPVAAALVSGVSGRRIEVAAGIDDAIEANLAPTRDPQRMIDRFAEAVRAAGFEVDEIEGGLRIRRPGS